MCISEDDVTEVLFRIPDMTQQLHPEDDIYACPCGFLQNSRKNCVTEANFPSKYTSCEVSGTIELKLYVSES